ETTTGARPSRAAVGSAYQVVRTFPVPALSGLKLLQMGISVPPRPDGGASTGLSLSLVALGRRSPRALCPSALSGGFDPELVPAGAVTGNRLSSKPRCSGISASRVPCSG